eukprot:scaffold1710_cov126-Isochrysis_galbana.AAC.6
MASMRGAGEALHLSVLEPLPHLAQHRIAAHPQIVEPQVGVASRETAVHRVECPLRHNASVVHWRQKHGGAKVGTRSIKRPCHDDGEGGAAGARDEPLLPVDGVSPVGVGFGGGAEGGGVGPRTGRRLSHREARARLTCRGLHAVDEEGARERAGLACGAACTRSVGSLAHATARPRPSRLRHPPASIGSRREGAAVGTRASCAPRRVRLSGHRRTFIRCRNVESNRTKHGVSRGLEEDGTCDVRSKRVMDLRQPGEQPLLPRQAHQLSAKAFSRPMRCSPFVLLVWNDLLGHKVLDAGLQLLLLCGEGKADAATTGHGRVAQSESTPTISGQHGGLTELREEYSRVFFLTWLPYLLIPSSHRSYMVLCNSHRCP